MPKDGTQYQHLNAPRDTGEGLEIPPSTSILVNHHLAAPRTKLPGRTPLGGSILEKRTGTEGRSPTGDLDPLPISHAEGGFGAFQLTSPGCRTRRDGATFAQANGVTDQGLGERNEVTGAGTPGVM